MNKAKTLKSLAKRVIKKKKKILRIHGGYRHLLAKKSSKIKRINKDKKETLSRADLKRIKKLI